MSTLDDQNDFADDDKIEELDESKLAEEETGVEVEAEAELEQIVEDDNVKPLRKMKKKTEARHALEDYFAQKQIKEALDYLDEEESSSRRGGKRKG